jgi:hypothetical protein
VDFAAKLQSLLAGAQKSGQLVALYIDSADPELFECGLVAHVDAEWVSLKSTSKDGSEDGLVIIQLDDVLSFVADSQYLRGLQVLMENRRAGTEELPPCSNFREAFAFAKHAGQVLTAVEFSGSPTTGFVVDYDDDFVLIEALLDNAQPDGTVLLQVRQIKFVELGRTYQTSQRMLHRSRYGR